MKRLLASCLMTACALVLQSRGARGQSAPRADHSADPLGDWFKAHHVQIRQTYVTTQDVGYPASFFWVFEPTASPQRYSLADLAVKVSDWQPRTVPNLLIYPVLEYHLASGGSAPQNKLSGTIDAEFVASSKSSVVLSPDLTASVKGSYDFRIAKGQQQYSLVVTPFSTHRPLPGAMLRFHNDAQLFRYYVHLGVERYAFQSVGGDLNTTTLLGSLSAELDPIPTPTAQYLQVTTAYSYRRRVGGDFPNREDLGDFSIGATVYPDGRQHFGVGVAYSNGRDATQRFARRERTDVGFRVKF